MQTTADSEGDATSGVALEVAVLQSTRGQHAFENCVEQLGTAIRLGVFPLGSLLPPERELADRMGVSRATLREVIAGLRAAGLVETTRGRGGGTLVTARPAAPGRLTAEQLAARRQGWWDTLDFRRIVEPGAAELAAVKALGPQQRTLLTEALEAVGSATQADHRQADSRFHLTLAMVTGSPRTIDAVTSVQAGLHDMLTAIPVLSPNIDHSDRQHEQIVAAVLDGDPSLARQVMQEHCDDTAALLRGLLQ